MTYLTYKDITDDLVIIKINKTYHKGMSERELYEYTRGFWKRRKESVEQADYALAVAFGEVVEVYRIDKWIDAIEADNVVRVYDPKRHSDRIAFNGEVAESKIRDKYIGKSVANLYKYGEANPVKLILKTDYSRNTALDCLPTKALKGR